MPARKTPSAGGKPDKLMRDALMLDLKREAEKGSKTKRLHRVATKLVDLAIAGDIQAIKEINDRVDGKAPQALVGDADKPLALEIRWAKSST